MAHICNAILVTCMDFRFQKYIEDWANKNLGEKNYDRVAWAGGVYDIDGILNQVRLSKKLHDVKKVVLINHEDCGAYGKEGTPQRHTEDLENARAKIKQLHPDLEVEAYYLHLDGTFQTI